MNAIEIKNLCVSYKNFHLDNINLTLPSGCIMGLIGENGAGKTTIIKSILDIVKPDSGNINVLERDNQLMFETTKQDLGVVLDRNVFGALMNADMVSNIMSEAYDKWNPVLFNHYLDRFNIQPKKKIKSYSSGMMMKLNLAVALSHEAKLLILDEPLVGLDPLACQEVMDILIQFTGDEDHSVLISSHMLGFLEKTCDYITYISNGNVVVSDDIDSIRNRYCTIHITREQLQEINPDIIVTMYDTNYGINVIALRDGLPDGFEMIPISLEELFIALARRQQR